MKLNKLNKKAFVWSNVAWWILGLIVLATVITAIIFILKPKGLTIIDKIFEIFRFGR